VRKLVVNMASANSVVCEFGSAKTVSLKDMLDPQGLGNSIGSDVTT